jgi:DNA repair protein SbcC/Rad50
MRPMRLSLTGFRSYQDRTVVDFTGKNLAAVLGDTGAGKSSILEAIVYVLYGRCSWDGTKVQQLIADGAEAMEVELTFLHDGDRWRVHRRVGRTSAGRAHGLENLDTGETKDNDRAVTRRIEEILQMTYATFESVVLLPQGRFDRLLTATAAERTEMLSKLFGADQLAALRDLADRRGRAINTLLGDAREARALLLPDPAEAARWAGDKAVLAEASADRLDAALASMTEIQQSVTAVRATRERTEAAAADLARDTVGDVDGLVSNLTAVTADLDAKARTIADRSARAGRREQHISLQIRGAAEQGRSISELRTAVAIIPTLPPRVVELGEREQRIKAEQARLAEERRCVERDIAALEERRAAVADLEGRAKRAATAARSVGDATARLGGAASQVLDAALRVAQSEDDHAGAVERHRERRAGLPGLQAALDAAQLAASRAEEQVSSLQTRTMAAALAAGLAAGQHCPVCAQALSEGFRAPHTAERAEIDRAAEDKAAAARAFARAQREHAEGAAQVESAGAAVAERARARDDARTVLASAVQEAENSHAALVESGRGMDAATMASPEQYRARLLESVGAVTAASARDRRSRRNTELAALVEPERSMQQAVTASADKARVETAARVGALTAEHDTLMRRRETWKRDNARLGEETRGYAATAEKFVESLGVIPECGRALLPEDCMTVTAEIARAATQALAGQLAEIEALERDLRAAQASLAQCADAGREHEAEVRDRLERPVRVLLDRLATWAQAARRAADHIPPTEQAPVIPAEPQDPSLDAVRPYADAMSKAHIRILTLLQARMHEADRQAAALREDLASQAAALADVEGMEPGMDLTAAQGLFPLAAAASAARDAARRHRDEQESARGQVRRAADLDRAIAAGRARHAALELLRKELAPARFPADLTSRRTLALLGVASDLLGRLSDGRFGFAADFQIVSRNSGVVHGAERLSGGEKFLASLALALALVELHSRGGPRLGALFLDEGFAALDSTTLETALSVLRAEAGGDRLVMVVSHLHAVAEAVDEVLWVERDGSGAGSTARWMTMQERDALVQMDVRSGLIGLA